MNTKNSISIGIKTITPIHIGSGRDLLANFEYLYFNQIKKVALVDQNKVLNQIGKENLSAWMSIIDRKERLLPYIQRRNPGVNPKDIATRIMYVPGRGPAHDENIQEQLHAGLGRPLLPGSSLKGAIRTAILTREITQNPGLVKSVNNLGETHRRTGRFQYTDKKLNARLLGRNPNEDIFRLLRVGDAIFPSTEVFKTQTLNKHYDDWRFKDSISPFIECIPSNQKSIAQMSSPKDLIREAKKSRDNPFNEAISVFEWKKLFSVINLHTVSLIDKEIGFWKEQEKPAIVGPYLESLENLKSIADNMGDDECLIRVGFGSGFKSMTGGWQEKLMNKNDYQDLVRHIRRGYEGEILPKTRKLSYSSTPMGFMVLSILPIEKVQEYREILRENLLAEQANLESANSPVGTTYIEAKPPAPLTIEYHLGRIREGRTMVDAVFLSEQGNKKLMKLFLEEEGQEQEVLLPYRAPLEEGTIYRVKVTNVDRSGKVLNIAFAGKKK